MASADSGPDRMLENAVRLGVVALLLFSAFRILAPFLGLMVWGMILAVAFGPAHLWLSERLGGAQTGAAILLIISALLFIVTPSVMLGDALGTTAYHLAQDVHDGSVEIPPPPENVKEWPVIGDSAYRTWYQASTNLDALLKRSSDRLVSLGGAMLRATGTAVVSLVEFAGSLVLAGFLLARRQGATDLISGLYHRMAPESGERLLRISEQTVRSVANGVLGVAIIQSVLVGIGLLVAGVPFAGVWSLLCLLLGIMQLPMGIVVTPLMIYQFTAVSTTEAILFVAYMAPVMLVDNVLKPLLLGRGVEAPMLVIFVGALGGFALTGFVGLFTGAIVLVLVYELTRVWLYGAGEVELEPDRGGPIG